MVPDPETIGRGRSEGDWGVEPLELTSGPPGPDYSCRVRFCFDDLRGLLDAGPFSHDRKLDICVFHHAGDISGGDCCGEFTRCPLAVVCWSSPAGLDAAGHRGWRFRIPDRLPCRAIRAAW